MYFIYLMAGYSRTLYIGVTSELAIRVIQHKEGRYPGFTSRYKVTKLVYFERFALVANAIAREKQLKRWSRRKKFALVDSTNPSWRDLSLDWDDPRERYRPG